jgi:hypothetical protein
MKGHPWFFRAGILAATLALAHCGGGGSGGSSAPAAPVQDAPTSLAVALNQPPASFHLTWTRPATAFDGYEFECRLDAGTYAKIHDGLIPNTWVEAYYNAGSSLTELASLSFRARVMREGVPSAYSNEASIRTGLLPPYMNYPYASGTGVGVSWTNNSRVADTLKLERGVGNGGSTTWTVIPNVPFGTTSWLDRNTPEGASCSYRVTYSKGQDSAQATSSPVTTLMVAPTQLTATPLVEGVTLSWQNPSKVATDVAVMRATGLDSYASYQQVALLPVGTQTYTDSQLATGYYTYRLENRKTGASTAFSDPVQVVTLPPQNGASVAPMILTLPQADIIRRSSQGAWFLSGSYSYNVAVREPSGTGWVDYVPSNAQSWASPYFLLDSQDRPHLVYTRPVVQGAPEVALMHAWRGAAGWQSEEIARRTLYSSSAMGGYTFALDAGDRLHVLWLNSGGNASDLEYATKDNGGTWVPEAPVTFTTQSSLGTYRLVLDPTGQPHVLVGAWQELFHLTRAAGTWSSESIQAPGVSVGWYDFLGGVAAGPDSIMVLASRAHQPYDGSYDLMVYRKKAGTWLPEEIALTTSGYSSFNGTLAASNDGTRFGLYYQTNGGAMLRVWTDGIWASTLVGPNNYGTPLLGFGAANKLYLLVHAGWGSSSNTYPFVLYQEQP